MKKRILGLGLLLVLFVVSCHETSQKGVTLVSPEAKQELLDLEHVQLIDVRTPEEYSQGHLVDSRNIDCNSPTFEKDIAILDKNIPVIVYCKSGGRSAKSAKKFIKAGFVKVFDLQGGYTQWVHEEIKLKN